MVAIKTWVPNELLKSADLNTAFGTAATGYMTGIICTPGTAVTIAANATAEIQPGAPSAGNDQGGYWDGVNKRVVIPGGGLAGWHLVTYATQISAAGSAGDMVSLVMPNGQGYPDQFGRRGTAGTTTHLTTWLGNLAAGTVLYVNATPLISGADITLQSLRIVRLALFGLFA